MDPLILKLAQMILTTIIGAALAFYGLFRLEKGLSGKTSVLVEGLGLKARLTNATPGLVVCLVGALIIYWSLTSGGQRLERRMSGGDGLTESAVLETWLANSERLTGDEPFSEMRKALVGDSFFRSYSFMTKADTKLGVMASEHYGEERFWPILASTNYDKGLFVFKAASAETTVRKGSVIEVWKPSPYPRPTSYEEFVQVRAVDLRVAYDDLRKLSKEPYGAEAWNALDVDLRKEFGFSLGLRTEVLDEDYTLSELSLRFYQDRDYWPLVKWLNPNLVQGAGDASTVIKKGSLVHVPSVYP